MSQPKYKFSCELHEHTVWLKNVCTRVYEMLLKGKFLFSGHQYIGEIRWLSVAI